MLYGSSVREGGGRGVEAEVERIRRNVQRRSGGETEFLQAWEEVVESLLPLFKEQPKYLVALEALSEPERVIQFRVPWFDQKGELHVNRGYRVEFNSAIGPYKGGLRFHPSVNLSVLKFLGFEQIFKNALTGLPMGGGKGGSDFDPKGKSDLEVRAFCQSFMAELSRHIGPDTDVPAGDIGTGAREIGFLFGAYRKYRNEFTGVVTGKGPSWGGSLVRPEATGYGAVYFAQHMLSDLLHRDLKGMTAVVSGAGNAAQFCVEKLIEFGVKVVTVSDSNGVLICRNGFTADDLDIIKELKNAHRGRLSDLIREGGRFEYVADAKPWGLLEEKIELAFPAATQNEIGGDDAVKLADKGCLAVIEVANMPSDAEAIKVYRQRKILYAPGKAANAGGVAVSGLEMAQNSMRTYWSFEEVDNRLKDIMEHIYHNCVQCATHYGGDPTNLEVGANIASFRKVADAMLDQGVF